MGAFGFNPERVADISPGSPHSPRRGRTNQPRVASAPWVRETRDHFFYPERVAQARTVPLCNPFRVEKQHLWTVDPGALRDPGLICLTPSESFRICCLNRAAGFLPPMPL